MSSYVITNRLGEVVSTHADMGDAWEAMRGCDGHEMKRDGVLLAYVGRIRQAGEQAGKGFRFGQSVTWEAKRKDMRAWKERGAA